LLDACKDACAADVRRPGVPAAQAARDGALSMRRPAFTVTEIAPAK
jgi:hypothetical protein